MTTTAKQPKKPKPVTEKQRKVAEFILGHFRTSGQWPTLREISTELGVCINAVRHHVDSLDAKGALLTSDGRRARAIAIPGLLESIQDSLQKFETTYLAQLEKIGHE
jgi:predicted ArsR family transcriptional regulator